MVATKVEVPDVDPTGKTLSFPREKFLQQVQIAGEFLAPNKLLPIYNYIAFIDNLILAFNGYVGVIVFTEFNFGEEGFLLPGVGANATIADILTKLDTEQVKFTMEGRKVKLESGAFKSELSTLPFSDFPTINVPEGDIELDPAFLDGCKRVAFTLCKDETKPALKCIQYEGGKMRTCDNYRFTSTNCKLAVEDGFQVPDHILHELIALGDSPQTVSRTSGQLWFKCPQYIVFGQLYNAVPPNLTSLEAKFRGDAKAAPLELTFDSKQLRASIDRVKLFSTEVYGTKQIEVNWDAENQKITLLCKTENQTGTDAVPAVGKGPSMHFAINSSSFAEAVEKFNQVRVTERYLYFENADSFHALSCLIE